MLQILGLWHPHSFPRILSWIYYLILVAFQFWFTSWLVYFSAVQFNLAVAILHGLDQIIFSSLWLVFPYILYKKAESLVNTIDYVVRHKAAPMTLLNVGYAVLFVLVLTPQVLFPPPPYFYFLFSLNNYIFSLFTMLWKEFHSFGRRSCPHFLGIKAIPTSLYLLFFYSILLPFSFLFDSLL
jgi:hypothetical protein